MMSIRVHDQCDQGSSPWSRVSVIRKRSLIARHVSHWESKQGTTRKLNILWCVNDRKGRFQRKVKLEFHNTVSESPIAATMSMSAGRREWTFVGIVFDLTDHFTFRNFFHQVQNTLNNFQGTRSDEYIRKILFWMRTKKSFPCFACGVENLSCLLSDAHKNTIVLLRSKPFSRCPA